MSAKQNVLVIGSGGREHAIAWSLARSSKVDKVFCLPGNGGTANVGTNVDVKLSDHAAVERFAVETQVSLIVIGPEQPLVDGLGDRLREKGFAVVGASQAAAQLEASKIYAKTFMAKYGIPTAPFRVFDNVDHAARFARSPEGRRFRVMKADGLAAGKGVVVARTTEELVAAIRETMEQKKFGDAGAKILLEETLKGPEVSVIALTDGESVLPFPASQDHKRAFDGDRGPNTGGMGAYSPTPFYDDRARLDVDKNVVENFLRGIKAEGLDFRGLIYFGIMLTEQGPMVLEFNVRFGDPEAQVILPLIQSDMYEVFMAVATKQLSGVRLQIRSGACCTVVIASKGYPNEYQTGFPISGADDAERKDQTVVFHAGTRYSNGAVTTNGGRVLNVTGYGRTLEAAVVRAYQGVKKISFKNMQFRNDIAAKAFANRSIKTRIRRMTKRRAKETSLRA